MLKIENYGFANNRKDLYYGRGRKGKHLSRKRALTEQAATSVILLFFHNIFHGA